MRPGLIFKAQAATEIRRLFAGPFLPRAVLRPGLIPFVPDTPRLRFQAVHSLDVGDAYLSDARGAFNLAADPKQHALQFVLFGACGVRRSNGGS